MAHPQLPDTAKMAAEEVAMGWVQPDWRDTREQGEMEGTDLKSHTLKGTGGERFLSK